MTGERAHYAELAYDKMKEAREMLDIAMAKSVHGDEEDYKRLRGCYERICVASDYLVNGHVITIEGDV